MIASGAQRNHPGRMDALEEGADLFERAFQMERPLHPGVAEIGDRAQLERRDAARLIDLAHQRALIADLARAVPRARAIGHAAVERHPDQPDVDTVQVLAIGRPHESREPRVTGARHRVLEFGQKGHGRRSPTW